MREKKTKRPGKLRKVFRQGVSTVVRIATLGQSQSHDLPLSAPVNSIGPPLRFHRTHGDNIRLESEGFKAKRIESFCKGILFTDRPLQIREKCHIKITNLSSRWKGLIRVGFSAHDPNMLGQLPKYACPDLTSKPGFWAKAIPERYSEIDIILHFYVSGNGDVHFGINGQDRGAFFSGVDTRIPLWGMIDLYGNCTGIELVDNKRNLNNRLNEVQAQPRESFRHVPSHVRLPPSQNLPNPQHLVRDMNDQLTNLTLEVPPPLPQYVPPPPPTVRHPDIMPLKYNVNVGFMPMQFHFCTGSNVKLSGSNTIATRDDEEFAQGYVFSATPIRFGERVVIQVLGHEHSYVGSLAFGLTNCDPSSIDTRELPEDSDMLLDRPEYWVVSKNVASSPMPGDELNASDSPIPGDELSFSVRPDGSVEFSKNNEPSSVFMHVDTSLRLWAFWDIYGTTSKIRVLGSTTSNRVPIVSTETNLTPVAAQPLVDVSAEHREQRLTVEQQQEVTGECIVCLEKSIDCVIYACGHMCMCHSCAMRQWKGMGGGFCPVCRESIRDVIKTFRS